MRILVPIKQVPETNAVKMDTTTGTMVREGVEAIVNPLDLYAIEAAVQLRERQGGEVVVLTMGPRKALSALREAVAMGADSAVLLSAPKFAGADTWATSHTLAHAIRKMGPFDLVLCGERATDGDTGQVGPALAAFLDLPVVTYAAKLMPPQDGTMEVHRLVEDGYQVVRAQLPAVLTVVKEVASPRLPTLRGKRKARTMDIPVWGPEDLALCPEMAGLQGSPTRVVKIFRPRVARAGEKHVVRDEASLRAAVDRLVDFLAKREALP